MLVNEFSAGSENGRISQKNTIFRQIATILLVIFV
jgi:hypothetical protein